MASYVDNSFRQAVMTNPAERTQQVREAPAACSDFKCTVSFIFS